MLTLNFKLHQDAHILISFYFIFLKTVGWKRWKRIKAVLVRNKLIYVGLTLLELSKYLMSGFRYNFIKKKLDADILFTDTDSLTWEIKSQDAHKDFLKYKH